MVWLRRGEWSWNMGGNRLSLKWVPGWKGGRRGRWGLDRGLSPAWSSRRLNGVERKLEAIETRACICQRDWSDGSNVMNGVFCSDACWEQWRRSKRGTGERNGTYLVSTTIEYVLPAHSLTQLTWSMWMNEACMILFVEEPLQWVNSNEKWRQRNGGPQKKRTLLVSWHTSVVVCCCFLLPFSQNQHVQTSSEQRKDESKNERQ